MLQGPEQIVDRFVRAVADDPVVDDGLVAAFVAVAVEFSDRHGIAYETWVEVGVPSAVLWQAGIRRSSAPCAGRARRSSRPRCARSS